MLFHPDDIMWLAYGINVTEYKERDDYSLVLPVRTGELSPFVGDFFSGSREMDGGAIFSPNAQCKEPHKTCFCRGFFCINNKVQGEDML